ncbi:MAG: GTP-binding protein [Cyanobium sp.]|nr:GTP-binding protein [Cyanobium sp.]
MNAPSTPERARLLLRQWRQGLALSGRERSLLGGPLAALDGQLRRLEQRQLRLAVFGRVGVGKSSLINALVGDAVVATDVAHGCTREQRAVPWSEPIAGLAGLELVDTPGIDEIAGAGRTRLAERVCRGADLVLLILDGDLNRVDQEALEPLLASGKPLQLVLNRSDCWSDQERQSLLHAIGERLKAVLPPGTASLEPVAVAAAPRGARLLADGRVRSEPMPAEVAPLRRRLVDLLERDGALLLAINSLQAAEWFQIQLQRERLGRGRRAAQGLIGRYAALKATGVVANPLMLLDLAGGLACDTALVAQLSRLYGLPIDGPTARRLLARLSRHNALLGGTQLGLQVLLGGLRQLLLLAAPLSGGLSLAPAAPVALAQAALAVHTTRRAGRLAAAELLRHSGGGGQPGALLRRLAASDPDMQRWLEPSRTWGRDPRRRPAEAAGLQSLLP